MTITIDPKLEARLLERADAEGLTVTAYLERLVQADQAAGEELESLAIEGLNSGDPIEVGPGFGRNPLEGEVAQEMGAISASAPPDPQFDRSPPPPNCSSIRMIGNLLR